MAFFCTESWQPTWCDVSFSFPSRRLLKQVKLRKRRGNFLKKKEKNLRKLERIETSRLWRANFWSLKLNSESAKCLPCSNSLSKSLDNLSLRSTVEFNKSERVEGVSKIILFNLSSIKSTLRKIRHKINKKKFSGIVYLYVHYSRCLCFCKSCLGRGADGRFVLVF